MTKRQRDPLHAPEDRLHTGPGLRPPRLPRPYREDQDRAWHDRLELGAAAFFTPIAAYLSLPQLRAFWPISSVDEGGEVYDISGQGRTLTNSTGVTFAVQGLTPYAVFDGSARLVRVDENALDIDGAFTIGCWAWFDNAAGGSSELLISKGNVSTTFNYELRRKASAFDGELRFGITDGAAAHLVASDSEPAAGAWHFVAGRYTPSTEIKLWHNTAAFTNTNSIPANANTNTHNLNIGSLTGGSSYLTGRIAFPFLCAAALSDATIDQLFQATRAIFNR